MALQVALMAGREGMDSASRLGVSSASIYAATAPRQREASEHQRHGESAAGRSEASELPHESMPRRSEENKLPETFGGDGKPKKEPNNGKQPSTRIIGHTEDPASGKVILHLEAGKNMTFRAKDLAANRKWSS